MADSTWKVDVLLAGSLRGASSVLLSDGRHHAVVDTGLPHEAHRLVQALEERGLKPSDIRLVINTHFHVDHVQNNSLFRDSLIYAPQESYEWSKRLYSDLRVEGDWERLMLKYYPEFGDYDQAATYMNQLRKFALRWWDEGRIGAPSQFRWMETESLPEGLEAVMTRGHVPGHASLVVHNGKQLAVIAGDAVLSRDHDEQVLTMIPVNRKQFWRDRARILSLGAQVVPGHDASFSLLDANPGHLDRE